MWNCEWGKNKLLRYEYVIKKKIPNKPRYPKLRFLLILLILKKRKPYPKTEINIKKKDNKKPIKFNEIILNYLYTLDY